MPPFNEIAARLIGSGLFGLLILGAALFGLWLLQTFAIAVLLRFLAFVWQWLRQQEVQLERREMDWRGRTPADVERDTPHLLDRQRTRWNAVLIVLYLEPPLALLTLAWITMRQPAWEIPALVMASILIIGAIVIFFG